jgi:hypothetical protein
MANALVDILQAATIIIAIFGMIYMIKDVFIGITLMLVCGVLIFLRAFIDKATR